LDFYGLYTCSIAGVKSILQHIASVLSTILYSTIMSGINKVILVGHLGKEPDLRYLPDHVAVVSFPLATSDHIMKNGVKVEQTEWHNIVMWRGLAESAIKVLKKGKLIYLEGKCRTRSFDDKNGIKKYTTEIVVDSFTLLGRSSDVEGESANDEEQVKRKRL
jgi:single-strand DNA-binding protein